MKHKNSTLLSVSLWMSWPKIKLFIRVFYRYVGDINDSGTVEITAILSSHHNILGIPLFHCRTMDKDLKRNMDLNRCSDLSWQTLTCWNYIDSQRWNKYWQGERFTRYLVTQYMVWRYLTKSLGWNEQRGCLIRPNQKNFQLDWHHTNISTARLLRFYPSFGH